MCDMGNPGKDFPCEVAPDRLSKGYYEFKPFEPFKREYETIWTLTEEQSKAIKDRKEKELWNKVAYILINAGIKDIDSVTDLIVRVFKEVK